MVDAPPKTLAELNDRVKQARGQQKVFWQEMGNISGGLQKAIFQISV